MADRLRDELRADPKTIRVDLKEMTDKNDALRQSVWAIGDKNNSLERQVTALTVANEELRGLIASRDAEIAVLRRNYDMLVARFAATPPGATSQ